jgi:hypothetical protein
LEDSSIRTSFNFGDTQSYVKKWRLCSVLLAHGNPF